MGWFSRKAKGAVAEIKRFDKKDLMEATIGAAFLVAGADGEIETSEMDKLEKIIRSNPTLSQYPSEVNACITRFKQVVQDGGMRIAKVQIKREIADVKADPKEAEDVFVTALTIAEADGQIEDAEKVVLIDIARMLNINPGDYDLAA